MSAAQATKTYQDNIDDAVNVLVSKLDEAIDDLENGRVLTEEELWAEIDAVQTGAFMEQKRYKATGFRYRGYDIHIKSYDSYLLFFTVDKEQSEVTILRILQDRQDWEYILVRWVQQNS